MYVCFVFWGLVRALAPTNNASGERTSSEHFLSEYVNSQEVAK